MSRGIGGIYNYGEFAIIKNISINILKKEETLKAFIGVGVPDEKGNFTKLHKNLANVISR